MDVRQKDYKTVDISRDEIVQKNRRVHTSWQRKKWRNRGRAGCRTGWQEETKKIKIKLAAICSRIGQQRDGKRNAELWSGGTNTTWKTLKRQFRRGRKKVQLVTDDWWYCTIWLWESWIKTPRTSLYIDIPWRRINIIAETYRSVISRNVKLHLYNTLIRPIVTYASETWVLKESMIKKLMIFERKIVRKTVGPTRSEDGYWRIKTDQEINDILKGQNIIGFINPSAWGHLNRSSYCDVGRLFYGVFKLWSKLQRKKWRNNF